MSDEPRKPGEMTEGSGEPVNPVDYAAGDLVVLRSGGPMLAIASVSGQFAHCIWFTPEDSLQRADIPLACLDPADGSDLMIEGMEYSESDFDDDMEDNLSSQPERPERKKKKKKKHGDS